MVGLTGEPDQHHPGSHTYPEMSVLMPRILQPATFQFIASNHATMDSKVSEYDWMVAHTAPRNMYDPTVPVIKWRHNMCLAAVVVCNSLSLLILLTRLAAQRKRFGKFRKADIWTICVTVMLVFPFWISQIMMVMHGGGYHIKNIKMHWRIIHWRVSFLGNILRVSELNGPVGHRMGFFLHPRGNGQDLALRQFPADE
ncbi:hypothetical protein B0J12DRAFT_3518 [Macrophomina phaseolina]|uniref:Uncharacterized protein n=1 Tax=Macrophomina phaseolina TaxID=35725 RepID=A0ABQ8GTI6_9PEZI|nr:hypothetical protein B0J12DRAFT_3518 [Macrophomina phaseolina]